jgi:hypothetical protein
VNGTPSPGTPPTRRSVSLQGLRSARALLALALLATGGRAAAQEPIAAVWKKEKILFTYQSSVTVYSCDMLRNRVASILHAVGARPDLEIKVTNCRQTVVPPDATTIDSARRTWQPGSATAGYLPATDLRQDSTVSVRLSMPTVMTPEVVEELNADKSRRELISRVTGNPIPRFDDPVPFSAERRVVTLSYETIGIEAAECELLDQLVTSSFDDLGLRVVRRGYSCDRRRASLIRPSIDVEALVPAMLDTREPQQAPADAGEETAPGAPAPSDEASTEPASEKPPG